MLKVAVFAPNRCSQGNATRQVVPGRIRESVIAADSPTPLSAPLERELNAIVDAAWDGYSQLTKIADHSQGRTRLLPIRIMKYRVDWLKAREAILEAQCRHDDASETPRILIIIGSSRSEHTCPGEMSKTWRLVELVEPIFREMGFAIDVLDLQPTDFRIRKAIHPCKSCVSTSMALCHWPCSCYPNYSLGQTDDWMNEIYPAVGRSPWHHDHHAC